MSQNIRDGFSRLRQLDLDCYRGNLAAFIDQIAIPNLRLVKLYSQSLTVAAVNNDILNAVALNFCYITKIDIRAQIASTDCLLKIVEGCRGLETLKLKTFDDLCLELDDVKAIATLPRLKLLEIAGGCVFGDGALSGLARCWGLRSLTLGSVLGLDASLPIIGGRLYSLDLGKCSASTAIAIVEHCPNLEYLALRFEYDPIVIASFVDSCKRGLKGLAKLKLNENSCRLGTDWEGY